MEYGLDASDNTDDEGVGLQKTRQVIVPPMKFVERNSAKLLFRLTPEEEYQSYLEACKELRDFIVPDDDEPDGDALSKSKEGALHRETEKAEEPQVSDPSQPVLSDGTCKQDPPLGASTEEFPADEKNNKKKQPQLSSKEKKKLFMKKAKDRREKQMQRLEASEPELVRLPFETTRMISGQRLSTLNKEEHERLIAMLLNKESTGTYKFSDNKMWFETQARLTVTERKDYAEAVRKWAVQMLAKNWSFRFPKMYSALAAFAKERFASKLNRIFSNFPRSAKLSVMHELDVDKLAATTSANVMLELGQALLELGKSSRLTLPDMKVKAMVAKPIDVKHFFPFEGKREKTDITKDPNVQTLLKKYDLQFAISASALKCLLLTLAFDEEDEWDLALRVDTVPLPGGGERKAIVFENAIGRRRQRTVHGLTAMSAKLATFLALLKYQKPVQTPQQKVGRGKHRRDYDAVDDETEELSGEVRRTGSDVGDDEASMDLFDGYDANAVETFGGVKGTRKASLRSGSASGTATKRKCEEDSGGSSGSDVGGATTSTARGVDALMKPTRVTRSSAPKSSASRDTERDLTDTTTGSDPTSPSKKKVRFVVPPSTSEAQSHNDSPVAVAKSSPFLAFMHTFQTISERQRQGKTRDDPIERAADFQPIHTVHQKQYNYDMWTLGEVKLLIRSSVDGILHEKAAAGTSRKVSVLPKVDYFFEAGALAYSQRERFEHYLTALMKRSEMHLQVRVAPRFFEVIHIRGVQPPEKLLDEELRQRFADVSLKLYNLLEYLSELNLTPRWHVLRCTSRTVDGGRKSTLQVLSEADGAAISLYDEYKQMLLGKQAGGPLELDDVWTAIDAETVLNWQRIAKHAPGLFPPRFGGNAIKVESDATAAKEGAQRKKTTKRAARAAKKFKNSI